MTEKKTLQDLLVQTVVVKGPIDWKGETPHGQLQNDDGTLTDLVVRDFTVANLFIRPDEAQAAREELVELITDDARLYHLLKSADTSSYLQLGGHLGDHGMALRLLALGEHLKLWKIYTPSVVFGTELDPEMEKNMIGAGYLSTDGSFTA